MKIKGLIAMIRNRSQREQLYSTPDYWNSKAQELDGDAISMWPNNNLNRHYHAEQLELLNRELPDVRGKEILDVGCGTGRISRYLASRGARVTGIDFSECVIELARLASSDSSASYRVQSMFELEDNRHFDFVFTWGSLTVAARNREELTDVMRRLHRSLKPGGRAFLLEPIHRGFVHRVLNMNVDEFCNVMQVAGFRVERVREMHFWPMRFVLAFIPWPAFITTPLYLLGQGFMKLPGLRTMGDYKVISAVAD